MFYGHAMLIGGKPERIEIFIVSGLSLSRPVDTKTDLKLNNIIVTPSSNLILTPLDECQRSEICGLDVTISARYDWSVASFHYVIGISGILPYSRNVTLQQECYLTNIPLEHSRFLPPTQYFRTAL